MNNDLISREALKKKCAEVVKASNNSDFIPCPTWNKAMELIDSAPTVNTKMKYQIEINGIPIEKLGLSSVTVEARPQLSDEQIEKITDLLETEWGYEGIREDVSRILRGEEE